MSNRSQVITIDFSNHDDVVSAMDKYHMLDQMIFARNEQDELQAISIYKDVIFLETYQNNGWTRKNTYHRDGTVEESYQRS